MLNIDITDTYTDEGLFEECICNVDPDTAEHRMDCPCATGHYSEDTK